MTSLRITPLSPACFGASRLSTVVDVDQCNMVDFAGLPFIGGKLLRGLLVEQVAVVLRALPEPRRERWMGAAEAALGRPGASAAGGLVVEDGTLGDGLVDVFGALTRLNERRENVAGLVTRALTTVRRQTRMDAETGTAAEHSLRSARLIRTGLEFRAPLRWNDADLASAPEDVRSLLTVAARLVRRGGLHRTRGWGRLSCDVDHADADAWSTRLSSELGGGR